MTYNTADFAQLYELVTVSLQKFVNTKKSDPTSALSLQDERWLIYLIEVFRQLFNDWQADQGLRDYLSSLEWWPLGHPRPSKVNRVYRLAGHVYLHVAYDLTRALAATLDATGQLDRAELLVPTNSDSFVTPVPVIAHARNDADRLFQLAAPAFTDALESESGLQFLGTVWWGARLLRVPCPAVRRLALSTAAQWVLKLRGGAWKAAERIADALPVERVELVSKLRDGIWAAQKKVANRTKLTDITLFDFPILSVSAPILLTLASSLPYVSLAASAVLLLVLWRASYWAMQKRQLELINAVNQLGAEILDALANVCREGVTADAGRAAPRRLRQIGSPILTLQDIDLSFGNVQALRGVSLEVREHEILGIVGPNGAGKTSLLNVINGVQRPQQGEIRFKGRRRRAMNPREAAQEGIARTFHDSAPFMRMTVLDVVMTGRELRSKTNFLQRAFRLEPAKREKAENRRKVEQVIELLGIQDILDNRMGQLPYERQRRVELARALVAEPELLLLDEPMAGLKFEEIDDMRRLILDLNDRHETTIVLVQHYMGAVIDILDRVVVLEHGEIIAEGTPEVVRSNHAVDAAYLSESSRAG